MPVVVKDRAYRMPCRIIETIHGLVATLKAEALPIKRAEKYFLRQDGAQSPAGIAPPGRLIELGEQK